MRNIVINFSIIFSLFFLVACLEESVPTHTPPNPDAANTDLSADENAAPEVIDAQNFIVEKGTNDFSTFQKILDFIKAEELLNDWLFFKDISIKAKISKALCAGDEYKCYNIYNMTDFYPNVSIYIDNPYDVEDLENKSEHTFTCTLKVMAPEDEAKPVFTSVHIIAVQ